MRIFSLIPVLAALVTAVVGCDFEMGCDPAPASKRDSDCASGEMGCGVPQPPSRRSFSGSARGLTNAALIRKGLPLKDPIIRRGTPVRRTTPSNAPPPPSMITHSGVIEVLDPNKNILGYVSKNLGNGGAQYVYDPSLANALTVTFQTGSSGSGSQLDITAVDSNPSWPLLGLVQGRDDSDSVMSSGSYEYLYLGGVANPGTQPGSGPQSISNSYFIGAPRTAETAVWTYNSATGVLSPQWINPDGTSPALQYWTQSTGLYVGGSEAAFVARYPAPATFVTFQFVPQ